MRALLPLAKALHDMCGQTWSFKIGEHDSISLLFEGLYFSPGQEEASELVNFFGGVCMLAACVHIHGILVILFLNFSFSPLHLCNFEIRVMERVPTALDKEDKALVQY